MIEVLFFKKSGKYYTDESVDFIGKSMSAIEIFQKVKDLYKDDYKGMHMVIIPGDEYEKGFPILITADERS